MKKYRILIVLLAFVMIFSSVACAQEAEKVQLEAPKAIRGNDTISWNRIANAESYDVYVDGQLYKNTKDTFVVLDVSDGEYLVTVKAVGDGSMYYNSESSNTISFKKSSDNDATSTYQVLAAESWEYDGDIDQQIEYVSTTMLKVEYWWRDMEYVLKNHQDSDGGYRAEFWGKMLRGAVQTYQYDGDEKLYAVMEKTVKNVLAIQAKEPEGRLSGYSVEREFNGWDLRSRYYLMLGLEYFHDICKDEQLKEQVLDSVCKQADYIIARIGDGAGQKPILTTSPDWGGCTSANLLDAIVRLYGKTKNEKYKNFAEYIIGTGGSTMLSADGKTLVQSALAGDPMYKWGCRKLYEVNIFFEGILDMYLLTGDNYYLRAAQGFYDANADIETTEIGSLAVNVEEACHSTVEQCNPDNLGRMNETCVGTTWMRYCLKLFRITGDAEIMDYIETEYYNFGYGIIDTQFHNNWPIFSYSPLATTARADVYSGTAYMGEQDHCQSCCVISGVALMPTVVESAILSYSDGFSINMYIPGKVNALTPSGKAISFVCQTGYPVDGNIDYTVKLNASEDMTLKFRIPAWSKNSTVKVNGKNVDGVKSGEYVEISRTWSDNDTVQLSFDMRAYLIKGSKECSNENGRFNVVVKRGPLVFARDYRVEGASIFTPLQFAENSNGDLTVEIENEAKVECQCQMKVLLKNGEYVSLIDYGSAGKTMNDDSIMCLWIPTKDYWSVDLTKEIVVRSADSQSPLRLGMSDNHMIEAKAYRYTTDKEILAHFAWKLELQEKGMYRIRIMETGGYLTIRSDGRVVSSDTINNDSQLFNLVQCGMNKYKFVLSGNNVLSLHDDGTAYITADINHPRQYWKFTAL